MTRALLRVDSAVLSEASGGTAAEANTQGAEAQISPAATPSGRAQDDGAPPVIPVTSTSFGMEWSAHGASVLGFVVGGGVVVGARAC